MVTDNVIIENIRKRGLEDTATMYKLDEELSQKRYLDKAPSTGDLDKVSGVCTMGGVKEAFKAFYSSLYDSAKVDEYATLDLSELNGKVLKCDYQVWVVLKSLIFLGFCKEEKQADACREIFMRMLILSSDFISKQQLMQVLLTDDKEYYMRTIKESILETLFTEEDVQGYRLRVLMSEAGVLNPKNYDILYSRYKGKNQKEVKKAIDDDYKMCTGKKKRLKPADKLPFIIEYLKQGGK